MSSEYEIKPLELDTGLDLVTPPSIRKPGTMEECLNYEIGEFGGYQRMGGLERSDAWIDASLDKVHMVILQGDTIAYPQYSRISVGQFGYPFGVVLEVQQTVGAGSAGYTRIT